MQLSRLKLPAAALALTMMLLSGCAVNRATAIADPTANFADIKRLHVMRLQQDDRGINQLIADRLNRMGYVTTTGPGKPKEADAIVTYADRWIWDMSMYMVELTIAVREPATDFPLATANSLHTSLTRKSPQEMVDEVTTNLFKAVKK